MPHACRGEELGGCGSCSPNYLDPGAQEVPRAGSDVPAPGVLWHHWGHGPEPHLGGTAVTFWGAPPCLGKPRGGRCLHGGHAARWVWGSSGGNRPDRLGAGTGGAGGLGRPRRRHSTWHSSRSLSPGPPAAVTRLSGLDTPTRFAAGRCFPGVPTVFVSLSGFQRHGRIPVALVVRKGEPALSSPGKCPAGAAVTHGSGGWGQRCSSHLAPARSLGRG